MAMPSEPEGLAIARTRIARERERRSGVLDLGNLGLKEWPDELWSLHHLACLNLGVGWTDDVNGFHFAESGMAYAPNALPAAGAAGSWGSLPNLRILSLAGPRGDGSSWDDLTGLGELSDLRVLDLSWTEADDLTPLAWLSRLEVLDASYTFVSSIAPLGGMKALRHLDLSHTKVANLTPLKDHPALETLLCYHTPVATVEPLAGLPALKKLDLTQTKVTTLDALAGLRALETLTCAWMPAESISESIVRLPALQKLVLHETSVANVPLEVLSADVTTNCLEAVRRWFAEDGEAAP